MKAAADLLDHLAAAGLRLSPAEGDLVAVEPAGMLTDEQRELIRANKPTLLAQLRRRQRIADLAADRLHQQPESRRAVQMQAVGRGRYLVAIAVRLPDGDIETVISTVTANDGRLLLTAFERACEARIQ